MTNTEIRLTQTVKKGGCAAKVAATELRRILGDVRFPPAGKDLLVDGRNFDDAAIFRVSDEIALVQTLDFFTPILDSPYDFGRVAAANAISDVYAMGGRPQTALAILAFPVADLPGEVVAEVMQGACDVLERAGASLAGGHSIDDDSLKFGLSVTGLVHPSRVWTNTGAKPGDRLILTKALGTGTVTAALKRGIVQESDIRVAIESMARLNNAVDYLESAGLTDAVHAATDITGFGLAGHGRHIARGSGVELVIRAEQLPRLPQVDEFLASGYLTKAHRTNREYTADTLVTEGLSATDELLLFDPQTSGGLLLSVRADAADSVIRALATAFPDCRAIGEVREASVGRILVSGMSVEN